MLFNIEILEKKKLSYDNMLEKSRCSYHTMIKCLRKHEEENKGAWNLYIYIYIYILTTNKLGLQ